MSLVRWSPELEIGIPFVDADHRVLVALLNQVDACIGEHEEIGVLGSVLNALADYTGHHFVREERLLALCGFTGLADHQLAHRHLSMQVEAIRQRFLDGTERVGATEVRDFLRRWLVEHILAHDFAYRDSCLGKTAAAEEAEKMAFGGSSFVNPTGWRDLRILVIDDNVNFRRLLSTILRAVGVVDVRVAMGAAEGLDTLARRPAHVVLCDWLMDDMDGLAFARELARRPAPPHLIMTTGFSAEDMLKKAHDLPIIIAGFIEKPISAYGLVRTIAHAAGLSDDSTKLVMKNAPQ